MNPRNGPARRRGPRRHRAECGGAVSLWVVLMVPVSAFAAVVAMAGPQRMAAESSMDEAADDLAQLAVAWRDGHHIDDGSLPAFPPECEASTAWLDALAVLDAEYNRLDGIAGDPDNNPPDVVLDAQEDRDEADDDRDRERARQTRWTAACAEMFEWMVRDLGNLGVDVNSLRGFYSGSLTAADSLVTPGVTALPCRVSDRVEVRDAVHVALSADWQDGGWAAAQVWPDGTRLGAESVGRLRRSVILATATELCADQLDVLDSQGRALVLTDPYPDSRKLSQSVPGRTVIEG